MRRRDYQQSQWEEELCAERTNEMPRELAGPVRHRIILIFANEGEIF